MKSQPLPHYPVARRQFRPFFALSTSILMFLMLGMITTLDAQPIFAGPIPHPFGLEDESSPDTVSWVQLVDIDNDGTLEAFMLSFDFVFRPDPTACPPHVGWCWWDLKFYKNNGDNASPNFEYQESFPYGIPNDSIYWPSEFIDLDGDGDQDLIFQQWDGIFGQPFAYLENTGTPEAPWFGDSEFQFNPFGIVSPVSDSIPGDQYDDVHPAFVDIDADGDYDFFMSGHFFAFDPADNVFDENFYFYRNIGDCSNPQFEGPIKNPFNLGRPPIFNHLLTDYSFVDMDCDGDWDMFTQYAGTGMSYHENIGTATAPDFGSNPVLWQLTDGPPPPGFLFFFGYSQNSWMDIGEDGDLDQIIGGFTGVTFWENISENAMACRGPMPQCDPEITTARVQFIHAADSETVELRANGESLRARFAYKTATPFMDVQAGTPLDIEIIPVDPWSTVSTISLPLDLTPGETYIVVLQGTFNEEDPYPVDFTVFEGGREHGTQANMVDMLFVRGAPDIPVMTDIVVEGGLVVADNVSYGGFGEDYFSLPAGSFVASPTPTNNNNIFLDPFVAHMSFWKGKSAVSFGTGLVSNGSFQPWVALSNGGTFPLFPPPGQSLQFGSVAYNDIDRLRLMPNPANQIVRVYMKVLEEGRNSVQVFSANGGQQMEVDLGDLTEGSHHFELNIEHLTAGIYYLKFQSASGAMMEPLVIVRD